MLEPALSARLSELEELACEDLNDLAPDVLSTFPIDWYIECLDASEDGPGYRHVPEPVREACATIAREAGPRAMETYHRLLLIRLMRAYDARRSRRGIPSAIEALIVRWFTAVTTRLGRPPENYYLHDNDAFSKDLGVCRLKLLPCGAELADVSSGIPRRVPLQGGLRQLVRSPWFFGTRLKGFKPVFELHWDRRLIRDFSDAGYRLCYHRLAELLQQRPDVRGVVSTSWWFDPALAALSGELMFLRDLPLNAGAELFRIGIAGTATQDAIRHSQAREQAYRAGRYTPTVYMLAWPRDDLLAWAKRDKDQ